MSEYKLDDGIPDLYEILGLTIDVNSDPNCNKIIQKAYISKAKTCHPDKFPGQSDVEEVFQLINEAYNILRDEKQRNAYNNKLRLDKQITNDFFKMRDMARPNDNEYKKITQEDKIKFQREFDALNEKHGFNPKENVAVSKKDALKELELLSKKRNMQEDECVQERLFDSNNFDNVKFNAAFDFAKSQGITSIIPHDGLPAAWNCGDSSGYSMINDSDNLYTESDSNYYGSAKFSDNRRKLTKADLDDIDISTASYVTDHNVIPEDYYDLLKPKLQSRADETKQFENMKFDDYDKSDTGGYGIFDQLGISFTDRLTLDDIDEEDISTRFDRLMKERSKAV